jgi:hypothetical protein
MLQLLFDYLKHSYLEWRKLVHNTVIRTVTLLVIGGVFLIIHLISSGRLGWCWICGVIAGVVASGNGTRDVLTDTHELAPHTFGVPSKTATEPAQSSET